MTQPYNIDVLLETLRDFQNELGSSILEYIGDESDSKNSQLYDVIKRLDMILCYAESRKELLLATN